MIDTDGPPTVPIFSFQAGLVSDAGACLTGVQQGSSKRTGRAKQPAEEAFLRLQACMHLDIESSPMQLWVCSAIFRFAAVGLPMTLAHSRQVDKIIPLRMVLRTKYGTLVCKFTRLLRG